MLYFNTNQPHSFFFFLQNTSCIRKRQVFSGGGGGAHPLHPPPRSAPAYTAISRKVVGQNVHATIPKGNMGYDQYTVPDTVAQSNLLLFLFLAPTNTRPWPLVSFFQTSLNESAFKTTHDTVRDCRVHFFRQSFSKYLYMGQLTGHLV